MISTDKLFDLTNITVQQMNEYLLESDFSYSEDSVTSCSFVGLAVPQRLARICGGDLTFIYSADMWQVDHESCINHLNNDVMLYVNLNTQTDEITVSLLP